MEELKVVMGYIKLLLGYKLRNKTITQNDIGIITPFTSQKHRLNDTLREHKIFGIDVGTVELFQGREKDIIILTTVRSKTFFHDKRYHIGFLSNPKRFNVALTRAKALLIVVGNPTILQTDKYWWYFLKFCRNNGACCGTDFSMKTGFNDFTLRDLVAKKKKQQKIHKFTNPNGTPLDGCIEMDDGVLESSDSSMIDENEYPNQTLRKTNSQANGYKQYGNNKNLRTEALLGDFVVKKMSDLKLEKKEAKKNKKKKNKREDDS